MCGATWYSAASITSPAKMAERRALFIGPATPARTGNGLAMRLGVFQDALSRVAQVDTLVLPVAGPPPGDDFVASFGARAASVPTAGRGDTLFSLLGRIADPGERLRQFRRYGRGSRHAALSAPVLADLRHWARGRRYDLAHIARLYLADAAAELSAAATSLDLDEDDAWAWRRLADTQPPVEADWSRAEADAEDRLLARRGAAFDARFVSGPLDDASLASRHPGLGFAVVPNAIQFPDRPQRRDDGRTLLFVGSFGYRPNLDGVLWFVREVWPRVRASAGNELRLRLVGRDPPDTIRALHSAATGVDVVGPVDEVAAAYAEATLAIAPLHTGSGTRIKIIEAAAYGVPVVTTRLAARGLAFVQDDSAWLADEPEAFATAVLVALADPAGRRSRAGLAGQRAQGAHDRVQVVDRLARRFADMLQRVDAAQGQ